MDRAMVAARRKEIEETMAELASELEDLAAFERVLDRQEGKFVKLAKRYRDSRHHHWPTTLSPFLLAPDVITRNLNRLLCKDAGIVGTGSSGAFMIDTLLRCKDPVCCTFEGSAQQMTFYDVSLPEKKPTLPEMITTAMGYLALREELPAAPKRVEEVVNSVFNPEPMTQNVSSVMWRMVKQGILVKEPGGRLYSLPKSNKAADEMSSRDPSAALESNRAKGQRPVTGVEHDGNLAH